MPRLGYLAEDWRDVGCADLPEATSPPILIDFRGYGRMVRRDPTWMTTRSHPART
jgi:hypothetical protein